jgi:hypothetical protein
MRSTCPCTCFIFLFYSSSGARVSHTATPRLFYAPQAQNFPQVHLQTLLASLPLNLCFASVKAHPDSCIRVIPWRLGDPFGFFSRRTPLQCSSKYGDLFCRPLVESNADVIASTSSFRARHLSLAPCVAVLHSNGQNCQKQCRRCRISAQHRCSAMTRSPAMLVSVNITPPRCKHNVSSAARTDASKPGSADIF